MANQINEFEKRAKADINRLKERYVLDLVTTERIQEILVYLYLSQGSRNPRGVTIQTEKLKTVLLNCQRISAPRYFAAAA